MDYLEIARKAKAKIAVGSVPLPSEKPSVVKKVESLPPFETDNDRVYRFLSEAFNSELLLIAPGPVVDCPNRITYQSPERLFYDLYSCWCRKKGNRPISMEAFRAEIRKLLPNAKYYGPSLQGPAIWSGFRLSSESNWFSDKK